nr:ABC transporter ATP-binding protein [Chitinophagales bacterium]
ANEILAEMASIPMPNPKLMGQTILTANQITKSYGVGKFKLGPVQLNIERGGVYGLVGGNGNGKTTLLRLLASDLALTEGNFVYSFLPPDASQYTLRTELVYIGHRSPKRYGSVKDNLKMVATHYGYTGQHNELIVLIMIARMGLWPFKNLNWAELSSGYKMRFELARTLLRKPEIMLLDEPLANLDVLAQQVVLEDIKSIAKSATNPIAVVLSSQQLYEVEKVSDRVIYLRNGKPDSALGLGKSHPDELVIELDTSLDRQNLAAKLASLSPTAIQYNGGIYVINFTKRSFNEVLLVLAQQEVPVIYVRDISKSTRRYFVR